MSKALRGFAVLGAVAALSIHGTQGQETAGAPYPPSPVIKSITWHWDTHRTAAPGSDLWPVTWGPDGHLYTAWGDGGGFEGTNSDGRVSMGFARIEGGPEDFVGVNINGGKNPKNAASFPERGKTGGMLFVDGVLYARLNMQDGTFPDVNHGLIWSEDFGATWMTAAWVFPKGEGNFKPSRFLNFGKNYAGVPYHLSGYVYMYGFKQGEGWGRGGKAYMARVPQSRMTSRAEYEFFAGLDEDGNPVWSREVGEVAPVFEDPNGCTPPTVAYNPALKRYILTTWRNGAHLFGVFDGPEPWGPWTTVAYYDDWGGMEAESHGLNCEFPQKWMSEDGLTMWCVFSVHGEGAKKGINAYDKFNLVKTTLELR